MANRDVINSILESNVRVSHFIIVPLDGPLPPKPGIYITINQLLISLINIIKIDIGDRKKQNKRLNARTNIFLITSSL